MSGPLRILARLASPGSALLSLPGGAYGVFPKGDRRRRPLGRLSAAELRDLVAAGVLAADGERFVLTEPGRSRLRRESAHAADEGYLHQHRAVEARATLDGDGVWREVRAVENGGVLRRLKALRGADGSPWLSGNELAAAARLYEDWLIGASDWRAPPRGASARGPGNAREGALAAHCDARARVADALERLAPPLRRVVERVCLREEGLEALERAEHWPSRSGKIALKLGLAQLAQG
ncbi:MAG: DUF6456 domain-containing protein [Hyphomonadaceae bacterium]|nr:DUF6456 domain-containing protein [Hyphomonadaceae bacterium]